MKSIIGAKNKYKLFLIIFLAGSLPAVATDWKGTWNSTFGKISISSTQTRNIVADMGDYVLRGNISGNATNRQGIFSGSYLLKPNVRASTQNQVFRTLGQAGKFSFTLSDNKQSFTGTATSNSSAKSSTWKGDRINTVNTTSTQTPVGSIIERVPNLSSGSSSQPVLWTGTWQTNKIGQLKIKWFSEEHIEAKLFYMQGDYIRTADLKGGKFIAASGFNHKYFFGGPYKDSDGKEGRFHFFIDVNNDPSLNTLSGYIYIQDNRYYNGQLNHYSPANINGITGTRTSSAEPNMNKYD